jgi:hypothetical protein
MKEILQNWLKNQPEIIFATLFGSFADGRAHDQSDVDIKSPKKAIGFRNIMIHEYEKVNWAIVYRIATQHLDDLKNFGAQVMRPKNF